MVLTLNSITRKEIINPHRFRYACYVTTIRDIIYPNAFVTSIRDERPIVTFFSMLIHVAISRGHMHVVSSKEGTHSVEVRGRAPTAQPNVSMFYKVRLEPLAIAIIHKHDRYVLVAQSMNKIGKLVPGCGRCLITLALLIRSMGIDDIHVSVG